MLQLFLDAVSQFGLPKRVRGDRGASKVGSPWLGVFFVFPKNFLICFIFVFCCVAHSEQMDAITLTNEY